MKYKIIELDDEKLETFSGKIVQVLKTEVTWYNYKRCYYLTCLVEVEE